MEKLKIAILIAALKRELTINKKNNVIQLLALHQESVTVS